MPNTPKKEGWDWEGIFKERMHEIAEEEQIYWQGMTAHLGTRKNGDFGNKIVEEIKLILKSKAEEICERMGGGGVVYPIEIELKKAQSIVREIMK